MLYNIKLKIEHLDKKSMNKSYLLAIIIAVVTLVWVGSGFFMKSDSENNPTEAEKSTEVKPKEATRVRVRTLEAKDYDKKIVLNGRSQASKNVTLRAEADGQVIEILREEGEAITKGQQIIKIDIQERKERVREARELVKQRQIEFEAAQKLIKQGFASNVRLAQTQSAYESARAGLKASEINLEKTTIVAPFDGILGQRFVDIGDYVRVGDSVSRIVDLNPLEVAVSVNEKEVVQIKKGDNAILKFAGGEKRDGLVTFISPAADEESRTFRVDVAFDNSENTLPAGLTAQVEISIKSNQAMQIPPSIITLNDAGAVGVKIVNADNKIEFKEITIVEDTPEFLWITALDNQTRVVIVGQDFVSQGQDVNAVEEEQE